MKRPTEAIERFTEWVNSGCPPGWLHEHFDVPPTILAYVRELEGGDVQSTMVRIAQSVAENYEPVILKKP